MNLEQLHEMLYHLAARVKGYSYDFETPPANGIHLDLRGFGHSKLSLAVHKETTPVEFAIEQATFMMFLGEGVCPKILSINEVSYVMEYLQPIRPDRFSLHRQESFLELYVWNRSLEDIPYTKQIGDESWKVILEETIGIKVPDWALDTPCIIHGDPTMDNTFMGKTGTIRVADPIPPHRLIRPSIRAIDHGKILQSFLGWETVLRGMPRPDYKIPMFMNNYLLAKRAIFWCVVALKRIALRNNKSNAGRWAEHLSKELEQCVS